MPKTVSEKCRLCAKLSAHEAITRHGPNGTGCWVGEQCHKRRSYYRNRDRYNCHKRQQYRLKTGHEPVVLAIAPPMVAAAMLLLYRARVDAPLHAIGAELRVGDRTVARIEPIHAQGLSASQVKGFLGEVLLVFSGQAGMEIQKFEMQLERSPDLCPVRPCPLHV